MNKESLIARCFYLEKKLARTQEELREWKEQYSAERRQKAFKQLVVEKRRDDTLEYILDLEWERDILNKQLAEYQEWHTYFGPRITDLCEEWNRKKGAKRYSVIPEGSLSTPPLPEKD